MEGRPESSGLVFLLPEEKEIMNRVGLIIGVIMCSIVFLFIIRYYCLYNFKIL